MHSSRAASNLPFDGSSMSSILGAITRPPHATSFSSGANGSTSFDDVSELDLSLVSSTSGSASVSLSSDLSGVSASTPTGKFALGFAQALESATYVDQTTGQREIQQGKAGELAATLNALLMQNGFSKDQASQVTQSLETELANGQPISLASSYDNVSSSSVSASGSYGSNAVWTANSVTQTEQSGSLNISIDASGQLNVSLKSQTASTAQYTGEIKGTGTAPSGPIVIVDLPGADGSTTGISLSASGIGATAGTPAFDSFDQATQAALQALEGSIPDSLKNGFSTPSANSPIKEKETDAAVATALTAAMLVTTHTSAPADANGQGGDAQSQSGGSTAAGAASNGTSPSGSASGADVSTLLSAVKQEASSLLSLLDSMTKTTLMGSKDAQKRLQDMLDTARKALDPNAASNGATGTNGTNGADASDASKGGDASSGVGSTGATGSTAQVTSTSLEVEISFTQTISLQLTDERGYGATLYARPDGSLGKMITQPTHVTA